MSRRPAPTTREIPAKFVMIGSQIEERALSDLPLRSSQLIEFHDTWQKLYWVELENLKVKKSYIKLLRVGGGWVFPDEHRTFC